jgi:hypothetical protein
LLKTDRAVGIGNDVLVFRVRFDHIRDLRLERRERLAREMLRPGLRVGEAQLITGIAVE